jgi:hypothetical protein
MSGCTTSPRPTAASSAPRASMRRSSGSLLGIPGSSGTPWRVSHQAAASSGTLTRKIRRQPHAKASTSTPPTNGPSAVNTPDIPDQAPIARPRSTPSNAVLRIARLPGTSRAAATPCSIRAATSIPAVGAREHSTEAAANPAMPQR